MNAFADLAADLEAYFHATPQSRRYPGLAGVRLEEKFRLALGPEALDAIVAHMDRDEPTAGTNMSRGRLRGVALELIMWEVHQGLREADATVWPSGETFRAQLGSLREQLAEFLEATRRR